MPVVLESFLQELDDLEARFGEDRQIVELNLARFFLFVVLGIEWGA